MFSHHHQRDSTASIASNVLPFEELNCLVEHVDVKERNEGLSAGLTEEVV